MSVTFLVYADLASLACMPSALYVSPMFFLHFFIFVTVKLLAKRSQELLNRSSLNLQGW